MAVQAAEWTVAHRALDGGGYRHGPDATPYLGDTLAMGQACLALYRATGDGAWRDRAVSAGRYIERTFVIDGVPGVATSARAAGPLQPRPHLDENVAVVRFAVDLAAWSEDEGWRSLAERAMRWLAAPEVARDRRLPAAVLLADASLRTPPVKVVLVGPASDPRWETLRRAALADPEAHSWVGVDAAYPPSEVPVAYVCANGACSSPLTDPAEVGPTLTRLLRR